MQSKRDSVLEILTSTAVGYGIAVISQILIFPFFGLEIAIEQNLVLAFWFTVISLVRGYAFRRVFNWKTSKEEPYDSKEATRKSVEYSLPHFKAWRKVTKERIRPPHSSETKGE